MSAISKSGLSLKQLGQREYHRQRMALIHHHPVQETEPRANEITLKEWLVDVSQKLNISYRAAEARLVRKKIEPAPIIRRANSRVIFVRI